VLDVMLKSNLMENILYYMLETPKTLSTYHSYDSENLKDSTMGNQQETNKVTHFKFNKKKYFQKRKNKRKKQKQK
jgi:hypothetical protein